VKLPPIDRWVVEDFACRAFSTDTETHKVQEGVLAPPIVCGAVAEAYRLDRPALLQTPEQWLADLDFALRGDRILVGAHLAYDLAGACAARPELARLVFAKLERGEAFDVLIGQTLDWIARGLLGGENDDYLRTPEGGKVQRADGKFAKRWSLDLVTKYVLGRADAKARDEWRTSYALLEGLPFEHWPPEAREYPRDDVRNALDNALAMVGASPRALRHEYTDADEKSIGGGPCRRCGDLPGNGRAHCPGVEKARNLHAHTLQTRAAFAYQLGSLWGWRTDPERVAAFEERVEAQHVRDQADFAAHGLIRGPDHPQCQPEPYKRQPGKFKKPEYEVGTVDERAVKRRVAIAYGADPAEACPGCVGTGKVPSPKTGAPIICKTCDGTCLALPASVPRTESGAVSKERDTLKETDDDVLDAFADVSMNEKLRKTYLPFLKLGTRQPITLDHNILLSSGRASYYGLIQLLPRSGGVRECFIPGAGWVLCSSDYAGVEMVTLAQSQISMQLDSPLARALLAGDDAHCRLGARMVGETYEAFLAAYKNGSKKHKAYRQASKPGNFGYGGGMGAAKFVLTQRKAAETTVGPDGTVYKGIRFCLILGRAERCGVEKITEWNDHETAPVCKVCVDAAEELRQAFQDTWNMRPYFKRVKQLIDSTGGEIMVPPMNRIRGGCSFTQAANGFFQGLAADLMKHALWEVTKEAYTDEASPLWGTRVLSCVHDELVATMPAERAHEAAVRLAQVQVEAGRLFVPDVAEALRAVPALMSRWWKGAEDIYDADGRLVPWDSGVVAFDSKRRPVRVRDDGSGTELLAA